MVENRRFRSRGAVIEHGAARALFGTPDNGKASFVKNSALSKILSGDLNPHSPDEPLNCGAVTPIQI